MSRRFNHPDGTFAGVLLILGGTTAWRKDIPNSGEWPALIEAADRALYMAKGCGRDRLVMSAELVIS